MFTDSLGDGAAYNTMLEALRFANGPFYEGRNVTAVIRIFAMECARRVLPQFERLNPADDRPRKCLNATELFLLGQLPQEQMLHAMWMVSDHQIAVEDSAFVAAYHAAVAATGFGVWHKSEQWKETDESDPMDEEDCIRFTTVLAASSAAMHAARMVHGEEVWQEVRLIELLGVRPSILSSRSTEFK